MQQAGCSCAFTTPSCFGWRLKQSAVSSTCLHTLTRQSRSGRSFHRASARLRWPLRLARGSGAARVIVVAEPTVPSLLMES